MKEAYKIAKNARDKIKACKYLCPWAKGRIEDKTSATITICRLTLWQ
jgi:hypothetical protein